MLLACLVLAACGSASAQQRETPYWATIDTTELNMRVGPSTEYKIDWVFRRDGLPVKVLRLREGWRYIEDPAGAKGWVAARYLSAQRGALVTGEGLVPMRAAPADNSAVKWNLQPGVVGKLGDCEAGWCVFSVGKRAGYVREDRLWGAGPV
ncbi:SH3 domain-containing protein [Parerythrobacter jejuensis]